MMALGELGNIFFTMSAKSLTLGNVSSMTVSVDDAFSEA